ncbi:MAG: NAD(+)/NADH kinase [Gammaproteobacteria bacterium]|nr:NAD(+)/NADH kinase [Gammaproteobacteria bacterium]MDH3778340.1 NAD(+)/NADH kinase [Gammaproteobacteria bacterium]
MDTEFRNIALVGRQTDARVAEPMRVLADYLTKAGIKVTAAEALALDLPVTRVAEEQLCDDADLVIAIGGDGTMLYASRLARIRGTPILGVNRGRLGFLADITPDEMIASVEQVLAGKYIKDSRLLLKAILRTATGDEVVEYGLNDVVVQRRGSGGMVDFSTSVAGQYVNTHSGDGLICATPTGSTAYALSCGGPIIEPQLDAVALVPICPHTLTDRPIVIPSSREIEIVLLKRDDSRAEITVDGGHIGTLGPGDTLTVAAASQRVTLLHLPGHDFYGILRSKLFWGRDSRKRGIETP